MVICQSDKYRLIDRRHCTSENRYSSWPCQPMNSQLSNTCCIVVCVCWSSGSQRYREIRYRSITVTGVNEHFSFKGALSKIQYWERSIAVWPACGVYDGNRAPTFYKYSVSNVLILLPCHRRCDLPLVILVRLQTSVSRPIFHCVYPSALL